MLMENCGGEGIQRGSVELTNWLSWFADLRVDIVCLFIELEELERLLI